MAYEFKNSKGVSYFLHSKKVTLRGGREQAIFYFAKVVNPESALNEIPPGYKAIETLKTGMPVLKKQ